MRKKFTFALFSFTLLMSVLTSCNNKENEEYLNAAARFYNNIESFQFISELTLHGYSTTWANAIDSRKDFNIALAAKKSDSEGLILSVTTLHESMGEYLKIISEASKKQPEKYEELYDEYKDLYSVATALREQVESPSGSLLSFNQNINSLSQDYGKIKGNIEIIIADEIIEKAEQIKEDDELAGDDEI